MIREPLGSNEGPGRVPGKRWEDATVDHYVVCLVDVLGIGDELRRWAMVAPTDPKTYGPIIQSVFPVVHFHLMFREFFAATQQGRKPDVLRTSMRESEIDRFLQCTEYTLGTQWFSDTFVFYARTSNARGDLSTVPVSYFLVACCLAMLDSLANGRPVRGAVCVGLGIELGEHNLFGPPFAQAHHLESQCAAYPRVIVSPETVAFVEDMKTIQPSDSVTERMKRMAALPEALIATDHDGQFIVDYLSRGVRDRVDGQDLEKLRAAVQAGYSFAVGEERRFREAGNVKLTVRYEFLCEYMESRLPIWGLEPDKGRLSSRPKPKEIPRG